MVELVVIMVRRITPMIAAYLVTLGVDDFVAEQIAVAIGSALIALSEILQRRQR